MPRAFGTRAPCRHGCDGRLNDIDAFQGRVEPGAARSPVFRNPLTVLVLSAGGVAVSLFGPVAAVLTVALAVAMTAIGTRRVRRVARAALIIGLPVAAAAVLLAWVAAPASLVVDARLGTGLVLAFRLAVTVAVLVVGAGAVDRRDVMRDLERRGLPRQVLYRVFLSIEIGRAMRDRIRAITAAQLARGAPLDTGLRARLAGRVAVLWPTLALLLRDVEERTLALEARGFHRPGRRELPSAPPDSRREAVVRLLVIALAAVAIVTRAAGVD